MSYTRKELQEIAYNVEQYRLGKVMESFYKNNEGIILRQELNINRLRREQLHLICSDLYIKSNGIHKEREEAKQIPCTIDAIGQAFRTAPQ
jgi:hypothetical protein